jgi:hypothetical protein
MVSIGLAHSTDSVPMRNHRQIDQISILVHNLGAGGATIPNNIDRAASLKSIQL